MKSIRIVLLAMGLAVASIADATPVGATEVIFNIDLTSDPAFPNFARAYFSTNLGTVAGAGLDVGESLVAVFYGGANGTGGGFGSQTYSLPFFADFATFFYDGPAITDGIYSVGIHVVGGSVEVAQAYGHALAYGPLAGFTPHYTASLATNAVPVPPTLALVGIALLALRLSRKPADSMLPARSDAG
jgi:hypothetical protein